jgi:YesN/AraC family two-component response regulator
MNYVMKSSILPKISLVNIAHITPPYVHKKRRADEYIMYVIIGGVMYLRENGIEYELSTGDVILLDPSYYHEGMKASECEYYYIHFRHEKMDRYEVSDLIESKKNWVMMRSNALQSNSMDYETYDESLMLPKYFHYENQGSFIKLKYILNEAIEENKTHLEGYKIKCSCKILEAMVLMERYFVSSCMENFDIGKAKTYTKVEAILNYINAEHKRNLSSEFLEEKFTCNFDYMNRIFRQTTGSTIFAYLNRVRIDHAKELLLTTSLSVGEIGEQVGFLDIYYFSKVFKKHTGFAPTQFLKSIEKFDSILP